MTAKPVILTTRVANLATPPPGSIQTPCWSCQAPCWIETASQELLDGAAELLCLTCAKSQGISADDVELTEAVRAELSRALKRPISREELNRLVKQLLPPKRRP